MSIEMKSDNLVRDIRIGLRPKTNHKCLKKDTKIGDMEAFLCTNVYDEDGELVNIKEITKTYIRNTGITEELLWDIGMLNLDATTEVYRDEKGDTWLIANGSTVYGCAGVLCEGILKRMYGTDKKVCLIPYTPSSFMIMEYSMYNATRGSISLMMGRMKAIYEDNIISKPILINTNDTLL